MIPKKLTIEGLYSYQEKQTIDFTNLTDAGLFGIFGATGSGKSSILEAISYGLYGQTERMNNRDKRKYNMMNLRSNRAYIEFDFYNHEDKLYRATREIKRNSKQFKKVRTPKAVFYEWKDEKWIPLDHTNAEKIVGLSYANFKRTIIIPQGQFREFLELGAKDRTNMMKEIFRLYRYDLWNKTAGMNKQVQSEVENMNGQLKNYESISKNEIKEKKSALKGAEEKRGDMQKKYQVADDRFQRLKHLKEDFEILKKKKESFSELEEQKDDVQNRQNKADEYERVYKAFNQLLKDLEEQQKEHKAKQEDREKARETLKELEQKRDKKRERFKEIDPYYQKLDRKNAEARDLGFIRNILTASKEVEKLKKRTQKGEKKVKEVQEREKVIQSTIRKAEDEIKGLKSEKLDSQRLREIEKWFIEYKNLNDLYTKQSKKVSTKKGDIKELLENVEANQINLETFESDIEDQLKKLNAQKAKLEESRSSLNVQQKLSEHANALNAGEPCPLCGSPEHPHIVEADDVTGELEDVTEELKQIETEETKLQDKRVKAERLSDRKQLLDEALEAEQKELDLLNRKMEMHQTAFVWEEFDPVKPDEFKEKLEQSNQVEKKIEKKSGRLETLRKTKEQEHKKFEEYREALAEIKKMENAKQARIDSNKDNLELLKAEDYQDKSRETVDSQQRKLKKKNREVKQEYESLSSEINKLKPEIASQQKYVETLSSRIDEFNDAISSLEQQVENHLAKEKIDEIQTVREILSQKIDVAKERDKIQQFRIEYEKLKHAVEELQDKLEDASFNETLYRQEEEKWKAAKQKLEEAKETVTKLKDNVDRLNKKLKEKQELQKQHKKLEKRSGNLKTMLNLFRGSGFVEYVSSIHLRQLCDHANERFQRLTRNQLSLTLNEDNDFEIIDYLNEGRSRSVKTLSGGQSFQVSLSLALALAESVQTNATANKNFFFIDEGFGTQDAESVNIIFETLLNLNKEDKIVGIISHVEELKDRIPMSLTIEKDDEKGSLVQVD